MASDNSPLESLAAFAIVFFAGLFSAVGFATYIERVKRNAQKAPLKAN